MRSISIIRNINRVVLGVTIVLYLTVIFGLLAQIVLGIFQLIVALVLVFNWSKLTSSNKKKLIFYLIVAGTYLALLFLTNVPLQKFLWMFVVIIPMTLVVYFTYFLESIKTKRRSVFSLN